MVAAVTETLDGAVTTTKTAKWKTAKVLLGNLGKPYACCRALIFQDELNLQL